MNSNFVDYVTSILYYEMLYFYKMYVIILENLGVIIYMETIFGYCDKCGSWYINVSFDKTSCYFCKNFPLKEIPHQYTDNFRWRDGDGKQAFIEEVVKKSPNLDQYLFEHKDEIIKAENDDMNAKMAIGRAVLEGKNRAAQCPSCGSSNISKIGIISRAVSTSLFGLASSKIGKTHKCNNCGTTW